MPFDQKTKTRMFVRCGRLCCLCLKQCGTNIEAAHIIDEHAGGSNEEENGIPVCLDCHQEIGAYDPKHPKGNKFTPAELTARRDRIYNLVESGAIYAQIVAQQLRSTVSGDQVALLPSVLPSPQPSPEGRRFLETLLSQGEAADAPTRKLKLLSESDNAYIIDRLLAESENRNTAVEVVGLLIATNAFPDNRRRIVLEAIVRRVTLFGGLLTKIALLESIPEDTLLEVPYDLRVALFDELLSIVAQDQWDEVNKLVPALVKHVKDIPSELNAEYVVALLDQSRSSSFKGAPAATHALARLPEHMVREALPRLNAEYLWWNGKKGSVKDFVTRYRHLAPNKVAPLLEDFLTLTPQEFDKKYDPFKD